MKYTYVPEEQLQNPLSPLKAGVYRFTIKEAVETKSKSSGQPMIRLRLECSDDNERKGSVFDYLGASDNQVWKIKQLADSVNDPSLYGPDVDLTPGMLINQHGVLELQIVKSAEYGEQPKVKFYMAHSIGPDSSVKENGEDEFGDDVPF